MSGPQSIIDVGASTAKPPRLSTTTLSGLWVFGVLFAFLAVVELVLYVSNNIHTREAIAADARQSALRALPKEAASASGKAASLIDRVERLEKAWVEATGVTPEKLTLSTSLPPQLVDLFTDPAGRSAAECWDRVKLEWSRYSNLSAMARRIEEVMGRAAIARATDIDVAFIAESNATLDAWTTEMDGHERCLRHLEELLRVRSLDPSARTGKGGTR